MMRLISDRSPENNCRQERCGYSGEYPPVGRCGNSRPT